MDNTHSSSGTLLHTKQMLDFYSFVLLQKLTANERNHKPIPAPEGPIKTREDLRIEYESLSENKPEWAMFTTSTSGSTGEPLTVYKSYHDHIWYQVCNVREILWSKCDTSLTQAVIKPGHQTIDKDSWGVPKAIAPKQGKTYYTGVRKISDLQQWLELKNPHYLYCLPSIRDQLDLSKVTNFKSWRGTGEKGGTVYSSEECGVIAIQCPDVPNNYHVMENQVVEVDTDGSMIISTMSNPYLRRYKHGDMIALGECTCGRTLQTITSISGRVRNLLTLPNGDKKWPLFGSKTFHDKYGIKRYKLTQTAIDKVVLQVISPIIANTEELYSEMRQLLESPVDITIEYVESFPNYKFEEFISLI